MVRPSSLPCHTRPEKIHSRHRERLAVVYIRQSTPQQVERHQESTRLQDALVERACQFGWTGDAIVVIDDDLGHTGSSVEGRVGFQRLVAEVSLGRVGLVVGIEMSRQDVPPGALLPGLASIAGNLRGVRYADR
jgi:Site-specific recombinases, DNA invertase Pin homologs